MIGINKGHIYTYIYIEQNVSMYVYVLIKIGSIKS